MFSRMLVNKSIICKPRFIKKPRTCHVCKNRCMPPMLVPIPILAKESMCPLDETCQIKQDMEQLKSRVTVINIYINSILDEIEKIKGALAAQSQPPPNGMT